MTSLGDPTTLDALGVRYQQRADDLTAIGRRIYVRADGATWTCARADRFRATVGGHQTALQRTSSELREVGMELRALASRLQAEIDRLLAIERRVRSLFASHNPASPLPPPWMGTRWSPANLPPSADTAWDAVGRELGTS